MRRSAFTLVELLVVIAIVGLLSTVAVVSLSSARAKARNVKRVADVRQLIRALDLVYDANGSYPDSGASMGGWKCLSASCLGDWNGYPGYASIDTALLQYMAQKPVDPDQGGRTRGGYMYNSNWTGGTGPSGLSFSGGATILYTIEPTSSCVLGGLWEQHSSFTECVVKL